MQSGWVPIDIAFGSDHYLYVLAYNLGYKVFKVDLRTKMATEIGTTYSGVDYVLKCSSGNEIVTGTDTTRLFMFSGIEAFDDDSFYVSTQIELRSGASSITGSCSTGSENFYNPGAVYGFNADGTQKVNAQGNAIMFGLRTRVRAIDGFGIRKGLNGHLYVSDYSFGLPWVIDRSDGFTIGRLGSSFGMLIFAHKMAFNPGPFGPRCDVALSHTNVKASDALTVTVDVLNGNGDPFCGEPHLTAVQSGYTWFGEAPTYNSRIGSYTKWKRDDTLCHRWTVDVIGEVASLVYNDGSGEQVVDHHLKDYCAGDGISCNLDDYKFSVSVYTGKLFYNNVLGSSEKTAYSVAPYLPFANETQLETSISRQTANATECADIVSRDEYGNTLLYGGASDQFSFIVDGVKYSSSDVETDSNGLPTYKIGVDDNGDGTYTLCSQFGPAGVHVVDIELETKGRSLPIKSSPLSVFVNPGPPKGLQSSGMGAGLESIKSRAGLENILYVQPRDSRGNSVPKGDLANDDLTVTVRVYSNDGDDDRELSVSVDWELEADGRFKVCYIIEGELESDEDYMLAELDVKVGGETVMLETMEGIENKELSGYVVRQGERIVKYKMSQDMRGMLMFECAVLMFFCVLFVGLVKYWRAENAIKFSQRKFLYIILTGIMCLYISFLLLIVHPMNNIICAVENFFFHTGICIVLLALGLKTYRTNKIANNKYMKRVKITDWMLLKFMGAAMLVVWMLLIMQAVKFPALSIERMGTPKLTEGNIQVTYVVDTCTAGLSPVSGIIWVGELSGIIYIAILAHFTRRVPSAFAEAKYIAISIYNIILVISFMAIMMVAVKIDTDFPELFMGVTGFAMFMGVGVMQGLIFIPKFVLILKGREVNMEDIMMTTKARSRRDNDGGVGSPMVESGRSMSGRRDSNTGVFRAGSLGTMGSR